MILVNSTAYGYFISACIGSSKSFLRANMQFKFGGGWQEAADGDVNNERYDTDEQVNYSLRCTVMMCSWTPSAFDWSAFACRRKLLVSEIIINTHVRFCMNIVI